MVEAPDEFAHFWVTKFLVKISRRQMPSKLLPVDLQQFMDRFHLSVISRTCFFASCPWRRYLIFRAHRQHSGWIDHRLCRLQNRRLAICTKSLAAVGFTSMRRPSSSIGFCQCILQQRFNRLRSGVTTTSCCRDCNLSRTADALCRRCRFAMCVYCFEQIFCTGSCTGCLFCIGGGLLDRSFVCHPDSHASRSSLRRSLPFAVLRGSRA